jgi:hypothetical protein
MSDDAGGGGTTATPAAAQPGGVTDRAKRWTDMSESVRQRAESSSKAIGSIGTAALSAVGIAKFGEIFPLPPAGEMGWLWVAVIGVPLGFVAMALSIAWYSARMWKVNEPIFMQLDPGAMDDITASERTRVLAVYRASAQAHGCDELSEYAARADELQAKALAEADTAERAALLDDARVIRADVDEAQARAMVNVVRLRGRDAVLGPRARMVYGTFLVGLLAFGIGTDYLNSERSARITAASDCAAAVKAVRESSPATTRLLPALCGKHPVTTLPAKTTTTPATTP